MNINHLLHTLWTKAVGTPKYDKHEWLMLEDYINGSVEWVKVPHSFVGRLDRYCEKCNLPDRAPVHKGNV